MKSGYPVGVFIKGCEIFSEKFKESEMTRKILMGLKNFPSEKNKGCETIRGAKFSSARENKGYKIFQCQRE